ncbi:uncharacterized protein [Montipora foliosa]|uniref:uncharacterized protein n=1 Tax=Montipora foliosa TaxID=591990 RepID=UPI0035F1D2B6
MATGPEYTQEQLNYFRICFITTDVITEGLRTIFKQEWDSRYKATLGEWKDKPQNGQDFKNRESPPNRRRNAKFLTTMVNGNTAEWDCTMLFYGILYSDCIGSSLTPLIRSSVDDLRTFRNQDFAHLPQGNLTKLEFQNAVGKVLVAFQALSLSDVKIKEVTNQTSFPTSELTKVLQQVKGTEQRRKTLEEQLQREATPFFVLPLKPSHHVARRDREVIAIHQKLKRPKEANENRLSYLYISGNPGSGKSQLAALVAEKWFDEETSDASTKTFVMTLDAQNLDSLLESYCSFARHLRCPEDALSDIMKDKDMDSKKKIANIKSLISTKVGLYSSWLLIVDNVVRLNEISHHLPQTGNSSWCKGQVLITCQDTAAIPSETCSINHISVSEGMMLSDALTLLASLSGIAANDAGKEVAQALDYQPLALASAATFVRLVREKISSFFGWKEYLQKLSDGQRAKTEAFLVESNPSYPKSMTKAISLAVTSVMSTDKVLNHAFKFISLCAQQPLNLELLINYVVNKEKENDGSAGSELADADIISLRIQESSLILIEKDESSVFVCVHQVVRDAIEKKIAENYLDIVHFEVLHGVITSFYQYTVDNGLTSHEESVTKSSHLVPHLKCLITEIEEHISEVKEVNKIRVKYFPRYFLTLGEICRFHCEYNIAKTFGIVALNIIHCDDVFEGDSTQANDESGDMGQAEEYYERHLGICRKNPGSQSVDVSTCLNFLGTVLHEQSDLEQAKKHFQLAVAIYQERLGSQHVNVASTFNSLGDVLRDQGELGQAKEYHERALAIYQKRLGSEHANVACTFTSLGNVLHLQGELDQAKEYHQRALAILQERLGSQNVNVASTFNSLGKVLCEQGELGEAKEYYERALAICQKRLGSQHVNVASIFNDLGYVLRDQGELGQAKEYHEWALAIYQKRLGSHHVNVACTLTSLGTVLHHQGELDQAKEHHQRALAIYQERLCSPNVNVASTFNRLGNVLCEQGELGEAKEYYEQALAICQKRLGSHHVKVACTLTSLGTVLHHQGELDQAKEHHQRALAIYQERLCSPNVNVASTFNSLGNVLCEQGELGEAKEYYERALAICQKRLGSHHVKVACTLTSLGTVLHHQGELDQAKEHHQRALAICQKRLGSHHVKVASIFNSFGYVLRDQGELGQAKEYHKRALAIYQKRLGSHHVKVASTFNSLGDVLRHQGELGEAKEYHERALAIYQKRLGSQDVNVARTFKSLGDILWDQGELGQAKEHFDRALSLYLNCFGPEHSNVVMVQRCLSQLRRQMRKHRIQLPRSGAKDPSHDSSKRIV